MHLCIKPNSWLEHNTSQLHQHTTNNTKHTHMLAFTRQTRHTENACAQVVQLVSIVGGEHFGSGISLCTPDHHRQHRQQIRSFSYNKFARTTMANVVVLCSLDRWIVVVAKAACPLSLCSIFVHASAAGVHFAYLCSGPRCTQNGRTNTHGRSLCRYVSVCVWERCDAA